MKKAVPVILLVLCLLAGCGAKSDVSTESSAPETTAYPTGEQYTEQDILNIFNGYAYADPSNRAVVDCVLVPDSSYGIIGVVQYTTDDYDGCWFDFLTKERPLPVGIQAPPAEDSVLEYIGKDTVSFQLLDDSGVRTYTIAFVRDEDNAYSFKVISEEDE